MLDLYTNLHVYRFQGPCVTIHLNITRNIGKKCGEYLFPKGSTYILGQKYWGSTFNGRRIYPFNKGLRIYGGVYHPPFDTLKKGTSAYDMNLKLYM